MFARCLSTDECFAIDPDLAPNASKDWFFCSAPATDAKMDCEAMPTFMGKMPDGSTVYICSTAK